MSSSAVKHLGDTNHDPAAFLPRCVATVLRMRAPARVWFCVPLTALVGTPSTGAVTLHSVATRRRRQHSELASLPLTRALPRAPWRRCFVKRQSIHVVDPNCGPVPPSAYQMLVERAKR